MKRIWLYIILIICNTIISNAKSVILPIVSCNRRVSCYAEKTSHLGKDKYIVNIIKHDRGIKKIFSFDSHLDFTCGFSSDYFLVLTNTKTSVHPSLFVFNFTNNDALICESKFDITDDYISTRAVSKLITTENGCYVQQYREWHNNDWISDQNSFSLRLGDSIPNKCGVIWSYDARVNQFSIRNIITPHQIKQYKFKQRFITIANH